MAFTPPSLESLTATLASLREAQDLARDIINNPLSSPEAVAAAQSALTQATNNIEALNSAVGGPLDSGVANAIINSPIGDIIPPNDYGSVLSSDNPVFNVPQPGLAEMAEENADAAKQYINDFIGEDTENIIDTNFVPTNDFLEQFSPPAQSSAGGLQDGDWQSLEYATDWNAHHGKFKFLFKIKFGGPWQYYVKSATKPKVKMIHQDVNFYNFRSKVLTQVSFDPMTVVLWDEIGNSVNKFFTTYLETVSGQGSGNWGKDSSFDVAKSSSSSKSYRNNGNGDPVLATVIIEQVFANGTKSNRFIFKNARIEAMDLDDLTMDATEMNTLSITFNYDSLQCVTVDHSVIHTDPGASKDLLRGGGAGGPAFGANDDGRQFDPFSIGGVAGPAIPGFGNLLNSAESIFANAIPSIAGNVSIGPGGVNVNIGGIVPGLGSGNVSIGPGGVVGGVTVGVPGFGGNLMAGPGGVVGGIVGGVPGVGGALTFGPGGIAGTGSFTGGPVTVGGAFDPNGFSASGGVAITSPVGVMAAPVPPIGAFIPESQFMNNVNIGLPPLSNLLVQPFNVT